MSEAGDKLVLDYLDRVADIAQGRLRPMDRITLIEDLRAQIDAQRKRRGDGPDAVRAILARQGSPKSQVDARLIRLAQPEGFDTDDGTGGEPEPEAGSSLPTSSGTPVTPVTPISSVAPPARAGRGGRRDVPVVPVSTPVEDEEAQDADSYSDDDMSPVIVAPVVVFAVVLLILLFKWWGFLTLAGVALFFPPVPRGVRIVALLWIPFWLFLPMVVTGMFLGMRTVLGTVYPLTAGVLGALYLMWGATRLPKLRQRR